MADRTRWGAVAALILAGVVVALQIGKAAIAVPVLQKDLSLTLVVASWVIGAYGVLGAIAGLPAGIMASLFSAKRTLLAGLIAAGLGSLAGAFVTDGTLLIATRVIEGCGFLAAVLALPRLLRAVTAPKDRDTVLAVWGAYMPVGSLAMMIAGPHLMAHGWQMLWIFNGIVALAYALVMAVMPLKEDAQPTAPLQTLGPNIKAVIGSPGPILLALAFGIYTFQYAAMANFLPTLLVDRLGLSISAAGTISAITVAANAVGNIFAGALLRMGAPIWAIAAFGYCFVGAAGFGVFSEQLPVIVIAALASVSLAVTGLIPASIFAAAPRFAATSALLAIVLGLLNQTSNLGNLFGPAAMAAMVQHFGWARVPFLFLAVTVSGLAVALMLRAAMKRASR
ncbi:MFS transporter [Pseudorhodoplanes sp.]|uniref:MFS transporter n=1 Tax=Pseudorhodoplanes sp. TaxID=1934341 RepID=UPI002CA21CBC|nr:MFS transporter [Pseudorhodoplanes sp.]HWV54549.1 MFS transporter [Pseudorhodoplanes sp.]